MGGGGEGENLADVKWTGGSKKGEDVIKSWYQLPRDSRSLSAILHTVGEGPVQWTLSCATQLFLSNPRSPKQQSKSFQNSSNPKFDKRVQMRSTVHKSRKSSYVAKASEFLAFLKTKFRYFNLC